MYPSSAPGQRALTAVLTILLALSIRYFFLDYGPDKGLLLGYNQSELSEEQQLDIKFDHLDRFRQPYLISPDSYFYLSRVNQYLESPNTEGNSLVIAYAKIVKLLRPILRKPTKYILYYAPVFLFTIILGAFFLFASAIAPVLSASLVTLVLSVSPSLVLNTQAGLIDHNALYLLVFVLIMGLALIRLRGDINYWVYLAASSVLVWFASTFWGSWILLTPPIAIVSIIDLLSKLRQRGIKNAWLLIILLALALATSGLFFGVDNIYLQTILERLGVISLDTPTRFSMTRELQSLSLIRLFHIEAFAWLSTAGLIYVGLKIKNIEQRWILSSVLVLAYLFLALLFQRLAVFLAIASGFFLVTLLHGNTNTTLKKTVVTFLAVAAGTHSILASRMTIASATRMDDQTHHRFELVNKLTPENALIVSWWDYGYYFNAISGRKAFSSPGEFSNTGRLRLIARMLYKDSIGALKKAKDIECRRRTRNNESCDFPIYLYIDDQFESFHHVIPLFLPKDEPLRNSLIDNPFIKDLHPCRRDQDVYFCGDHKIELKRGTPKLISEKSEIHSFMYATYSKTKYDLIDQSGEFTLVFKKTDSGFSLIKTHKDVERTPLFQLMIYEQTDHPSLKAVYREEQKGRMLLLKYLD